MIVRQAGAILVGGPAAAMPFFLTLRPMARFDVGATALFTAIAGVAGFAGAFAWREAAWAIFYAPH